MNIFNRFLTSLKRKDFDMDTREDLRVELSGAALSRTSQISARPRSTRWKQLKRYFYNRETQNFCGRSILSWVLISGFYLLFLIGTSALFALIVGVTLHFIESYPTPLSSKYQLLSGSPPGFSFFPNKIRNIPLIWYDLNKSTGEKRMLINAVDNFLREYNNLPDKYYVDCEKHKSNSSHVCKFQRSSLGPCSKSNYGYGSSSPCFFVKLNKHPTWVPKSYDRTLPKQMPKQLRNLITGSENKQKIWVSCSPYTAVDKDHLGDFSYYPDQGIPNYYFPFEYQKHYLRPVVAVQISRVDPGYFTVIQCSVWAENIPVGSSGQSFLVSMFINK